jgi:hypothetical protein
MLNHDIFPEYGRDHILIISVTNLLVKLPDKYDLRQADKKPGCTVNRADFIVISHIEKFDGKDHRPAWSRGYFIPQRDAALCCEPLICVHEEHPVTSGV